MEKNFIDSLTEFYTKNSKLTQIVLLVVIGLPSLFFAYQYFYQSPREDEAAGAIYNIQYEFGKSDTAQAHYNRILNGETGQFRGALYLANNFSNTPAGELAKFYAGYAFYQLGKYDKAIEYLEDCSIEDKLTNAKAIATLGDAYAEKKNYTKAASLYEDAAQEVGNNLLFAPVYYLRSGILYTIANKNEQAVKVYEKSLATFPHEAKQEILSKTMPSVFDQIKRNLASIRTSD